jgi:hypothetical protein
MSVASCHYATQEDVRRLGELRDRYGERFNFALESEIYLRVRCKSPVAPSEKEVIGIYKIFFWNEQANGIRSDSSFVYLNLYDNRGKFLYQLAYDRNKGEFIKGRVDHY